MMKSRNWILVSSVKRGGSLGMLLTHPSECRDRLELVAASDRWMALVDAICDVKFDNHYYYYLYPNMRAIFRPCGVDWINEG